MKITADPVINVCHCRMCQSWTGGPMFSVIAKTQDIVGHHLVHARKSSDWAERASCTRCGSSLWYHFLPSDQYFFCAGSFDLPATFEIKGQIFTDEKPAYYDLAQNTVMKTGAQVLAEAGFAPDSEG
ncbi:GFA family protein [Altererythrobacter endophyticus]|uniref:GFA family protein n=2 Tax=Altericroceibacterium endophyticum TaxID=1808508 RepID=A0A6I4TAC7_9SPHN|nr:GFA family protein [Altericroceibacterium endophyticum]